MSQDILKNYKTELKNAIIKTRNEGISQETFFYYYGLFTYGIRAKIDITKEEFTLVKELGMSLRNARIIPNDLPYARTEILNAIVNHR